MAEENKLPSSYEEWEYVVFDNAAYFAAVSLLGQGQRERHEFKDLEEAMVYCLTTRDPFGRRPILAAVTAAGRHVTLDQKRWPDWLKRWKERKVQ